MAAAPKAPSATSLEPARLMQGAAWATQPIDCIADIAQSTSMSFSASGPPSARRAAGLGKADGGRRRLGEWRIGLSGFQMFGPMLGLSVRYGSGEPLLEPPGEGRRSRRGDEPAFSFSPTGTPSVESCSGKPFFVTAVVTMAGRPAAGETPSRPKTGEELELVACAARLDSRPKTGEELDAVACAARMDGRPKAGNTSVACVTSLDRLDGRPKT